MLDSLNQLEGKAGIWQDMANSRFESEQRSTHQGYPKRPDTQYDRSGHTQRQETRPSTQPQIAPYYAPYGQAAPQWPPIFPTNFPASLTSLAQDY